LENGTRLHSTHFRLINWHSPWMPPNADIYDIGCMMSHHPQLYVVPAAYGIFLVVLYSIIDGVLITGEVYIQGSMKTAKHLGHHY
jgi:hypothetical protein